MGIARTSNSEDRSSGIQSVETAFNIIERIYGNDGVRVTELANLMDMPKSTAHIYLKTLERAKYVVKNENEYKLSYQFLRIGGGQRYNEKVFRIGKPVLEALAEETGELVDLLVEEHGLGVLINKSMGEDAIEDGVHLGQYVHLHSTASGKAILAHSPPELVEHVVSQYDLPQLTPNTISDWPSLEEELDVIREQGVAFNYEEQTKGLRAIGAPIRTNSGDVLGSISICGPTVRMSEERMENELMDKVIEASNIIELQSEPATLDS